MIYLSVSISHKQHLLPTRHLLSNKNHLLTIIFILFLTQSPSMITPRSRWSLFPKPMVFPWENSTRSPSTQEDTAPQALTQQAKFSSKTRMKMGLVFPSPKESLECLRKTKQMDHFNSLEKIQSITLPKTKTLPSILEMLLTSQLIYTQKEEKPSKEEGTQQPWT